MSGPSWPFNLIPNWSPTHTLRHSIMMPSCSASTASFVAPADIKQTCCLYKKRGLWTISRPFSVVAKDISRFRTTHLTSFNKRSHFRIICFCDPQFNKQQIFLWSNFSKKKNEPQQKQCNKQITHCSNINWRYEASMVRDNTAKILFKNRIGEHSFQPWRRCATKLGCPKKNKYYRMSQECRING